MKRKSFTLAFWALFLFAGILTAEAHQYKLIRIFNSESFAPDRGIECVARNGNSSEFVVNSHEYAQILKTCDSVEVIINDLEAYYSKRLSASKRDRVQSINGMPAGSMSGYYKLDEIYDFMENLTVDFPELVTREEIGRTWEDRPIWAYTIGCSDGECPEALLTALHHAREPMSVMSLLHFIYNLFENYLNNNPEAIYIMNNRRMVVVPVVNPDGYAFNQRIMPKGGGFWRRNRRPINDTTWGVDLNRNYGPHYLWDHPNGGSSTDIQSDTYRGPAAFSEPETRAIRDLCLRHNFRIALNLHSWGNLLLYPWGVLDRETEDSVLYRAFSQFINLSTKYVYGLDSETVGYIARGASDDWLYLESPEKPAIIAFTPEIGNRLDGFWPQSDRIAPLTANNLPLFYETAHSAGVNIRPVDYSIEYSENESQKLSIRFCNIGTGDFDGEKDVIVRPLNNKIKVKYPDRKIYILPSGRSQTITFDIDYEKGFPNGDIVPFEVSVSDEQLGRKDTLDVRLVIPKTIVMYDGQTLREQWDAGDWGLQFIEFAKYYLSDSPFEEYAAATDNYITWREPIDLTFAEAAELEIASRWMIERTYDFAVAQISTNGGETWEYLRGTRSVEGLGIDKTKPPAGAPGWHGNMKDVITERISLDDYAGQSVILRFGVLSDKSKKFSGWDIASMKLHTFDFATSVDDAPDSDISIRPQPAIAGEDIIITLPSDYINFEYELINIEGSRVYLGIVERTELRISTAGLAAGVYYFRIYNSNGYIFRKIIIIR